MSVKRKPYVNYETQYIRACHEIMVYGSMISDERTGTGTLMLPGMTFRVDLSKEVPILTTKHVGIVDVFKELKWMISGDTSQMSLSAMGCSIWDEWAGQLGQLGPIYPAMWRRRPASVVYLKPIAPNYGPAPGYISAKDEPQKLQEQMDKGSDIDSSSPPALQKLFELWGVVLSTALTYGYYFYERWLSFENFKEDFFKIPGCEQAMVGNTYVPQIRHKNSDKCGPGILEFVEECRLEYIPKYTPHPNCIRLLPVYYIDQLGECVEQLKIKGDRRCIVDCWEPSVLPDRQTKPSDQPDLGLQSLACCHYAFQFHKTPAVNPGGLPRLSITVTMRSNDMALGNPYNMPSYAMLLMMVANVTGCEPWMLTLNVGDCHVYTNHVKQLKLQILRKPKVTPKLVIREGVKHERLEDFTFSDFELTRFEKSLVTKYDVAI